MSNSHEPQFDRYLRGDLTPAEARKLAQNALESPALFEELSLAAVAIHGASSDPDSGRPAAVVTFSHRRWTISIGAAAAAVALIAAYVSTRAPRPDLAATTPQQAAPIASLDPAAGKPTLLATDLTSAATGAPTVFRSAESDSRAPRPEGAVIVLDNLTATVNLGAIDGLENGTELNVFRGASQEPVGRVTVTTVFRDRARGMIVQGTSVQPKDRVQANPAVYLGAVLGRINSLAGRGDVAGARTTARAALAWAQHHGVSAGAARQLVERLGSLDYRSGDIAAAEADYRSAVQTFNSPPPAAPAEQSSVLNSLGALLLLRGDTARAEAQFRQITPASAQTLNNQGVSAELRGDRQAAQALYGQALRALDSSAAASSGERRAVQTNLARVSGAAHENR